LSGQQSDTGGAEKDRADCAPEPFRSPVGGQTGPATLGRCRVVHDLERMVRANDPQQRRVDRSNRRSVMTDANSSTRDLIRRTL
jgi:hypothetical protein